jgi:hypothetical protein
MEMMIRDERELWKAVKALKGKVLKTYVGQSRNEIVEVEDTGKADDRVIIKDRKTSPTREDIVGAYTKLIKKGKLTRKDDLDWLASQSKQVSSIVFRIVGEVMRDWIVLERKPKLVLILRRRT